MSSFFKQKQQQLIRNNQPDIFIWSFSHNINTIQTEWRENIIVRIIATKAKFLHILKKIEEELTRNVDTMFNDMIWYDLK